MKEKQKMPILNKVTPTLLQVMPYEFSGKKIEVKIETDEFTCLCPWTGLPDFAFLKVVYVPGKVVLELKSLKMYLQSYRMVGVVHESAVNSILKDLSSACKPLNMIVELVFKVRGGITTTVSAQYKK
ncbi:MAG: preQ(1) synthase [Endomicrobiales bacterium]|nr:preQ(1) synthase [Endomicrobiales bacterium]